MGLPWLQAWLTMLLALLMLIRPAVFIRPTCRSTNHGHTILIVPQLQAKAHDTRRTRELQWKWWRAEYQLGTWWTRWDWEEHEGEWRRRRVLFRAQFFCFNVLDGRWCPKQPSPGRLNEASVQARSSTHISSIDSGGDERRKCEGLFAWSSAIQVKTIQNNNILNFLKILLYSELFFKLDYSFMHFLRPNKHEFIKRIKSVVTIIMTPLEDSLETPNRDDICI